MIDDDTLKYLAKSLEEPEKSRAAAICLRQARDWAVAVGMSDFADKITKVLAVAEARVRRQAN